MDIFQEIKEGLRKFQFIIVIGKYDHVLGPRAVFSSFHIENQSFIRNLLRDSLNTANKFVNIDYGRFYSQVCKVDIEDPGARGGKQLYAIIILRDSDYPLIPTLYFQKIEMLFHKIGTDQILKEDMNKFKDFAETINEIYKKKEEILPIEEIQLKIRSGINTIQGFCELLLEMIASKTLSSEITKGYVEIILDSCGEITNALKEQYGGVQ